jgi:hypothetical protein
MANSIEADRAQLKRLLNGSSDLGKREGLQQPQHLDVLPGSMLVEPRL